MRILHVVLTPRHSGAELLAATLAEAHAASGFGVTGIVGVNPCEDAFQPVWRELQEKGVWCVSPTRPLGRLRRIGFIRSALLDFRPDVVVAHSVIPAAYARLAAKLAAASGAVVTVLHAATNDDYAGTLLRISERLLQPLSAAVVTVTETAAKNYRLRCGSPRRLLTIPNGIELCRFAFDGVARRKLRSDLAVADHVSVALQVGRLAPVKNQAASVLAMKEVVRSGQSVELWFAGLTQDVSYERDLRRLVVEHGLQEKVRFLGSRTDVAALLSASDVFLMPSEREAHSLAMIEALANGVPIVASAIPVFEFATHFSGVVTVDPTMYRACAKAIKDAASRSQVRYERDLSIYSIAHVAKRYAALFREVTSATSFEHKSRERAI